MTLIIGFAPLTSGDALGFVKGILFAVLIIGAHVGGKKLMANNLDAAVTHETWTVQRFGFKPTQHFKKPVSMGVLVPFFFAIVSFGALKVHTYLTYETRALKRRAARRHGHASFTEMTDWHIGLIGTGGIAGVLLVSFIGYWIPGLEGLASTAAWYAFFNLLPISKLDGSQIFFGSRTLYATLGIITMIIIAFALLVV